MSVFQTMDNVKLDLKSAGLACHTPAWVPRVGRKPKIVAFDLDFTLVRPKGKNKFPSGGDDWKWMYDCVPAKLAELTTKGYLVVIISNQKGVKTGKTTIEELEHKLTAMLYDVQMKTSVRCLPAIYIATDGNHWRKPFPTIWEQLLIDYDLECHELSKRCKFVGDAGGRRKDFSASDKHFAHNAGIKFKTPEKFFLGVGTSGFPWHIKDKYAEHGWDGELEQLVADADKILGLEYRVIEKLAYINADDKPIAVILQGAPACGKSTWANRLVSMIEGLEWLEQDKWKTKSRTISELRRAVASRQSVIIDATNRSRSHRKKLLDLIVTNGYHCVLLEFEIPKWLCMHMNQLRVYRTSGMKKIPDVAIHTYFKNVDPPDGELSEDRMIKIIYPPSEVVMSDIFKYRVLV